MPETITSSNVQRGLLQRDKFVVNEEKKNVTYEENELMKMDLEQENIELHINENIDLDVSNETLVSDEEKNLADQENLIPLLKQNSNVNNVQVTELLKCYEKSEKLRLKTKKKLLQAKRKIKRLEQKAHTLHNTIDKLPHAVKKLLNQDQISLLCGTYKKMPSWSEETLQKAYKYKFICGSTGYERLRKDLPLPSLRTLCRRLENLKFDSGILHEVFKFLQIKISQFTNELDKHCVIILDEMMITRSSTLDPVNNTYLGYINLTNANDSNSKELATHALVIMLADIGSRWKQIIAYYFTGRSFDGSKLKIILCDIINKTEEIGLRVHSITSDMGTSNMSMWKAFGIMASPYSKIVNSCIHPTDKNRKLYFFHDAAHAFKNLNQDLLRNECIILPDNVVNKYSLPTNEVEASHIKELCSVQENALDFGLALAPKLKRKLLDSKNHFLKMKVSSATSVINNAVSSGLEFVSREIGNSNLLTTAWFINMMSKWFKIIRSRNIRLALSKLSEEKFSETIAFLEEINELMICIKVGQSGAWKPFQTGIIISTQSIIDLSKYLLDYENFEFVFTSRFMQDCVENLFSVIRSKNVIPNALQFKNNLKLITVSQYMKNVSHSSYQEDDREFFSEFLSILIKEKKNEFKQSETMQSIQSAKNYDISLENNDKNDDLHFNNTTLNCLYYVAGYVIYKIIGKNNISCSACISSVGSKTPTMSPYAHLTQMRCFNDESLFFVNDSTFEFFIEMEKVFRLYYKQIHILSLNLKEFFIGKCINIFSHFPLCHSLKEKIIKKFISFRLKKMSIVFDFRSNNQENVYASKSVCMHAKGQ